MGCIIFESDKVILSKSGMYVEKRYEYNVLFKLNVMTIIKKENSPFIYLIESSNLWHGKLGHINFNSIRKLVNMEHIMRFQIDYKHKCEICVEAKSIWPLFQIFGRNIELLELIHSDMYSRS